ncbi:MAG: putative lipid II flippase FtsW [Candidatus Omnitrophica bacterium]|nr:putative lipid II flippase FtsW [Candidatus Omnitrophota bacterium]
MNINAKIVLLSVSILMMIGIVMIYSSSAVYSYETLGDSLYFVKRHLIFIFIGMIAAIFCMSMSAEKMRGNVRWFFLLSLAMLILVALPGFGTLAGGARRWIRIGGFGLQPSEIAKLAVIFYLADFTGRNRYKMHHLFTGFVPSVAVISLMSLLVLLEPDLGTAVSIGVIGLVMLFASGIKLKHLFVIVLSAMPLLLLAIVSAPYRLRRVMVFFEPWNDPKGAGFQLIQSFIALGSGGIFGVGLGSSKQKLFYLPQSYTDFIYSIIGEEMGFLGAIAVLSLFFLIVFFTMRISFKLKDVFMSRVVFGIGVMIAFESIVNIGVSVGALPTKGLPLPFISYGGSSLLVHLAAIGVILNMARHIEESD